MFEINKNLNRKKFPNVLFTFIGYYVIAAKSDA